MVALELMCILKLFLKKLNPRYRDLGQFKKTVNEQLSYHFHL